MVKTMEERQGKIFYYFGVICFFMISFLFIEVCEDCPTVSFYLPVSEEQDKYFQQEYALS